MTTVVEVPARLDLSTCPACGQRWFRLASEEHLIAYGAINHLPDGRVSWDGKTEIDWNTSRTHAYVCRECGAEMPEELTTALDAALGVAGQRAGRIGDPAPDEPDPFPEAEWELAWAARAVEQAWESGDLAAAVRALSAALDLYRAGLEGGNDEAR